MEKGEEPPQTMTSLKKQGHPLIIFTYPKESLIGNSKVSLKATILIRPSRLPAQAVTPVGQCGYIITALSYQNPYLTQA
jgi:hypothetical protein